MRKLGWLGLLVFAVACTDVVGPRVPAPSNLEYCGYDETPCEEPGQPGDSTGTIVITVQTCVPWENDPTYPYCP